MYTYEPAIDVSSTSLERVNHWFGMLTMRTFDLRIFLIMDFVCKRRYEMWYWDVNSVLLGTSDVNIAVVEGGGYRGIERMTMFRAK